MGCNKHPALQLNSVSTHAPIQSVAAGLPTGAPARPQLQRPLVGPYVTQPQWQLQQQLRQEFLPQSRWQQYTTEVTWQDLEHKPGGRKMQQQQQQQQQQRRQWQRQLDWGAQAAAWSAGSGGVASLQQHQPDRQAAQLYAAEHWQQLQWQVVDCCASLPQLAVLSQGAASSGLAQAEQSVGVAPQPEPLYRLVTAAKHRQASDPEVLQLLMDQLQPLLLHLAAEHLAHAAWAAAQLADKVPPGQQWLQLLLDAANSTFQVNSSSKGRRQMSNASVATLLQALVKLQQRPSPPWLTACCASMGIESWACPRALSTVAACLPQLGHVPSADWSRQFFQASGASLPGFPAISLARMLHGVVAWQHLGLQPEQQQQQPQQEQQVYMPEHWLLGVLRGLDAQSSQLKPVEVAMVLQSMQRMQQQQQQQVCEGLQLLPAAGHQPATALQQAGQQLLHSLMAALLQQLDQFQAKDLTVALLAVAALHDQQQAEGQPWQQQLNTTSWPWLQNVLVAVEARLPFLDPRGQAACLAATAALIKPHLQHQLQQHEAVAAAEPDHHHRLEQVPAAGSSQLQLMKPLRRWLQHQQSMMVDAGASKPAAPADGGGAAAAPAPTAAEGLQRGSLSQEGSEWAGGTADASDFADAVAGCWHRWLSSFYMHSSQQLTMFSPEDLTVTACSLASMQQVPPVSWYERLLHCIQQRLPAMTGGQASGVAWALGRMALLPSQHDAGVSLVPAAAWMKRLYPTPEGPTAAGAAAIPTAGGRKQAGLAAVTAAAAAGAAPHDDLAALHDDLAGSCTYALSSCAPEEVVRLMWAAGMCDLDPGATWWAAAEEHIMAPALPPASHGSAGDSTSSSSSSAASHLQVPVRLLGLLLQAYAAAGRRVPPALLQHFILAPCTVQQLLQGPVLHVVHLLRGLAHSGCEVPQEWLQRLAAQLQPRLVQLSPELLHQLLGSLAEAGLNLQQQQQQQQVVWTDGWQGVIAEATSTGNGVGGSDGPAAGSSLSDTAADTAAAAAVTTVAAAAEKLRVISNDEASAGDMSGRELSVKGIATGDTAGSTFSSSSFRKACLGAGMVLLPHMSLRQASLLLSACAKLHLKPPQAWLESVLQRMQAGFLHAELPGLALAMAACSSLGYIPGSDWMGSFMMATHRKVAAMAASPHRDKLLLVRVVLQLLWGLSGLQISPNPKWLKLLLLSVHQQLPLLTPLHVSTLMLALARLQCRPSPVFLQSLLDRLGDCSACSNADLVRLAYSAAVLRWQPNRRWCSLFLAASASRLDSLDPSGLALLQWALAVIRITPIKSWRKAAMRAAVRHLESFDAPCLAMLVWAWARQMVGSQLLLQQVPEQWQKWRQQQEQPQRQDKENEDREQLAYQPAQPAGSRSLLQRRRQLEEQQQLQQCVQQKRWSSAAAPGSPGAEPRRLSHAGRVVGRRLLAAAWRHRGSYSAKSLAHLLAGVAKLRLAPSQEWLAGMVLQGSREKLSVLTGYELHQLVWAAARLGFRAPQWWVDSVAVLIEVRILQQQGSIKHSAACAIGRLQQLAAPEERWTLLQAAAGLGVAVGSMSYILIIR